MARCWLWGLQSWESGSQTIPPLSSLPPSPIQRSDLVPNIVRAHCMGTSPGCSTQPQPTTVILVWSSWCHSSGINYVLHLNSTTHVYTIHRPWRTLRHLGTTAQKPHTGEGTWRICTSKPQHSLKFWKTWRESLQHEESSFWDHGLSLPRWQTWKYHQMIQALATTDAESRLYEFNARNQITLWGPDGDLFGYHFLSSQVRF